MRDAMIISSANSKTYKKLLKAKNFGNENNQFFVEGYKNVIDSIKYADRTICIIISDNSAYRNEFESAIIVEKHLFDRLCDTVHNQGIAGFFDKKKASLTNKKSLLLYKIRDPGNMGTIIRTAASTGFVDIYLYDCVSIYNTKVIRSSMSSIFKVNFQNIDKNFIKDNLFVNYELIAFDIKGENFFDFCQSVEKFCLVFGNESKGLDEFVLELCKYKIRIPMKNEIESLNVAVSSSIAMYKFFDY